MLDFQIMIHQESCLSQISRITPFFFFIFPKYVNISWNTGDNQVVIRMVIRCMRTRAYHLSREVVRD